MTEGEVLVGSDVQGTRRSDRRIPARAFAFSLSFVICLSSVSLPPPTLGNDPEAQEGAQGSNQPPGTVALEPLPIEIPTVAAGSTGTTANPAVVRSEDLAAEAPAPPATPTEDPGRRTEFSKTIVNPDGSLEAEVTGGRMHFRDTAGDWQDIDTTLVEDARAPAGFNLRQRGNDIAFAASDSSAAEPFAQLAAGDRSVAVRGLGFLDGVARRQASGLVFDAKAGGSDVMLLPTPEGFEFRASLPDGQASMTYRFALALERLTAELADDGQTVLLFAQIPLGALPALDGNRLPPIGGISAPSVFDAQGSYAPAQAINVNLDARAPGIRLGEVGLTYTISRDWLDEPDRAFPVVFDPTVCLQKDLSSDPGPCNLTSGASGYVEHGVASGIPNTAPGMGCCLRAGTSPTGDGYGINRSLLYFPWYNLPEGAQITKGELRLYQTANYSGRILRVGRLTEGWATNTTWNTQPASTDLTGGVATLSSAGYTTVDIGDITRSWYTREPEDWEPMVGLLLRLGTESHTEVRWSSSLSSIVANRPRLRLTYVVPKYDLSFDPSLGPDFVPTTISANTSTVLPIRIKNTTDIGSSTATPAFTFNMFTPGSSDYYRVGYELKNAAGTHTITGSAQLPADIAAGATSPTINLQIGAQNVPGQNTLRIFLQHVVDGAYLDATDWADPGKFYSRQKDVLTSTNTRWNGSSVIDRAEFNVAVTRSAGASGGFQHGVALGDGSRLALDLWTRNLRFEGAGGIGFDDLGRSVGVDYYYDDGNSWYGGWDQRVTGTSVYTNFDEGIRREGGGSGPGWRYRDASGSIYPLDFDANGQIISSAPVLIERPRMTFFDENVIENVSGTNALTYSTTYAYNGARSMRITADATAAVIGDGMTIELNRYPLVSLAVRSSGTDKAAYSFKIHDAKRGTDHWFSYTFGASSWAVPGTPSKHIAGSLTSGWRHHHQLHLWNHFRAAFPDASDDLHVTTFDIRGASGGTGYLYYDAVRFEGRALTLIGDSIPSGMTGAVSLNTADAAVGSASLQVTSPSSPGNGNAGRITGRSDWLHFYPFVSWHWRKVGGTTMSVAIKVKNLRTNQEHTICYVAGPGTTQVCDPGNRVVVSEAAPAEWTQVTRNVLEDARQIFAWYNDNDTTGTSQVPNGGPVPDEVSLTGYTLIPYDGSHALFDDLRLSSIPNAAETADWGAVTGDDWRVTYPGRELHRFNRDGFLTAIEDADGNATRLTYSYEWDTSLYTRGHSLTAITAPSDGMPLVGGGTSNREIAVTRGSGYVRFTEKLGAGSDTGRSLEFTIDSSKVTAINPARHSGACGAPGVTSNCLTLGYATDGRLTSVRDPSSDGLDDQQWTISWNDDDEPTAIINAETGAAALKVLDYAAPSGAMMKRVQWQDADMAAANHAAYADLSPNGTALVEWRPVACTQSACADGTTSPASSSLVDKARTVTTDGLDRITTETVYRLPGNGDPLTTRRATLAAAKVDNYADPLASAVTTWSQTADQYAASVEGGNPDAYRTAYTYNAHAEFTGVSTPLTNPAGGFATQQVRTLYDAEGHPTQSDDNFVVNPGFESSLNGWTGTAAWTSSGTHSGFGALNATTTTYRSQTVTLLPGQTFRAQAATKASGGASARVRIQYERASDGAWVNVVDVSEPFTAWSAASWQATVPVVNSTGRVRVYLDNGTGTGTASFDDVTIITQFAASTYAANGLVTSTTDIEGRVTVYDYDGEAEIVGAANPPNLLTNGGFRDGTSGWSPELGTGSTFSQFSPSSQHWTLRDGDIAGYHAIDGPFGSTANIRITDSGVGTQAVYQRVPATPGATYSVSALLGNHRLTRVNLLLFFQDASYNWLNVHRGPNVTGTFGGPDRASWSYETLTAIAPPDAQHVVVKVEAVAPLTSGTDGYAFFDQIRLIEGDRPLPYVVPQQNPAIFPMVAIANYTTLPAPDSNVVTYTAHDRWGRPTVVIDPDGVAQVNVFDLNATDVASVHDGLGNTSSVSTFDAVGHPLTSLDPVGNVTTTAFNLAGQPTQRTAPNGRVDSFAYNTHGQLTKEIANYVDGTPSASDHADITTSYTHDAFGNLTRIVADDGTGTGRVFTDRTFDLLGNEVSSTVYADEQAGARTTTTFYSDAGRPAGTQLPIAPASPAPACPNPVSGAPRCHSVATLDLNGRATLSTDAYGIPTRTWYDFAGQPVLNVVNWVDGAFSAGAPDADLRTTMTYDLSGRPTSITDALGRTTTTEYDLLGRPNRVIAADLAWRAVDYTPAGRTLRTSSPGGATEDLEDVTWTESRYDAGGRQTHTVANSDYPALGAQTELFTFEAGHDRFTDRAELFIAAGAAVTHDAGAGHTGAYGLEIDTSAGTQNQGVARYLTGSFLAGQTYVATIHAKGAASGQAWGLYLGLPASGQYAGTTATSTGDWQTVSVSWTPSATADSGVVLAFRANREQLSANTVHIDDVTVYDANGLDTGIPSSTVYDRAGRAIMTLAPPATAGAAPLATRTTYTDLGQPATVTTNFSSARSGPEFDFVTEYGYDPLGRQTEVTGPDDVVTRYEYDRLGRQLRSKANFDAADPNTYTDDKNVTGWVAYNDRGELTASCAPHAVKADGCDPTSTATGSAAYQSAWHYTYDAMGHQVSATPPLNTVLTPLQVTGHNYDAAGLRLARSCSGSSSCVSGTSRYTDLTYDAVGRPLSARTYQGAPGAGVEQIRGDTTYDALGNPTAVAYYRNGSGTAFDTITTTYDLRNRALEQKRGSTLLTGFTYNGDGTLATGTGPAGTATFAYDRRDRLVSATSPLFSGNATYAWRNDGLLAERGWPNGAEATYDYDAARRVTGMTLANGSATLAEFERSYDRIGNVTSETQVLDGISGLAGSETQTFTYDPLRRLTDSLLSDGVADDERAYTYDAGSRRTSKTENGVTTTYAYDRNDQLVSQAAGSGAAETFTYDAYGRLTVTAASGATTAYTYDLADRLVSISPPSGGAVTYELDALGRKWTRSVGGVLSDTLTYAGSSYSIVRIAQPGVTIDSGIDAIGTRLATATSAGAFGYALPDLHGNFAAAMDAAGATISDAFRYDAYGQVIDSTTSSLPTPWRFQGKPLLSSAGDADLYDFESRAYDPGLGAFTQMDTVAGGIQNPLTLNRYLYGHANPTTFIDPDGRVVILGPMIDGVRHQHAKPAPQSLSYAPPRASFSLAPRKAAPKPTPKAVQAKKSPSATAAGPFYEALGVEPATSEFTITAKPGYGRVHIAFFIEGPEVGLPTSPSFIGDDRGFDPDAPRYESRAFILLDFEEGTGVVQVNPTCTIDLHCEDPFPLGDYGSPGDRNRLQIGEADNGALLLQFGFRNPIEAMAPAISGLLIFYPDPASGSFGVVVRKDSYPSFESYQTVNGEVLPLLLIPGTTPLHLVPPDAPTEYYFP